jgi:hypothetical protein
MSYRKSVAAVLFASTILFNGQSRAWGPEGYAMIAEIAEIRLANSPVLDQIKQVLAADDSHAKHLDQIASWADAVRPARPETQNWHFVDIPLDAADYDAGRDCKQTDKGDCVIAAIQRSVAVLRDRNADSKARVEALKFIVHFVGDIHQPLHTVNDCSKFPPPECDRGGNKVKVRFREHHSDNFHSVWDGGMIEDELQLTLGDHFQPNLTATFAEAKKLENGISDTDAKAWAPQRAARPSRHHIGQVGERLALARTDGVSQSTDLSVYVLGRRVRRARVACRAGSTLEGWCPASRNSQGGAAIECAVEKVPNCFATNLPPKDESRDDCS